MNFNVRESATTARCSRRKTPWALLLPGCPPRGCPDFNPAPASPRLLALGSLPRWAAPAIYDLPGLCPLTRPSSWTSDLWEPWCWRTSSPVASCRQRFDAGSRAPLRDTGGGGLRPPYETSRLGTPFRLPANLFGAPQPTADPARAGCARRGSVLNALAPHHPSRPSLRSQKQLWLVAPHRRFAAHFGRNAAKFHQFRLKFAFVMAIVYRYINSSLLLLFGFRLCSKISSGFPRPFFYRITCYSFTLFVYAALNLKLTAKSTPCAAVCLDRIDVSLSRLVA